MSNRLLTLAVSHYCEKARWGLERAGIPYDEERHVPGLHRAIVARHRAGVTVPILITPSERIGGSAAILHWIDARVAPELRLYPDDPAARGEVEALERRFDDDLGPATRLMAYFQMLPRPEILYEVMDHGLPRAERFVLRRMTPAVNFVVRNALGVNEEGNARAAATVATVFSEVGERLADGRSYLVGDRFSAADLAFATMAAPVLWPEQYGSHLPALESAPPEVRAAIEGLRSTPAGQYALQMFSLQRDRKVAA